MADVVQFLLARIGADASQAALAGVAVKAHAQGHGHGHSAGSAGSDEAVRARRVLAECDAKRRRVAWAQLLRQAGSSGDDELARERLATAERLLALEAAPYADHPDFQDEWRL